MLKPAPLTAAFLLALVLGPVHGHAQTGWTNVYAPPNLSSFGHNIALDSAGNVFVGATSTTGNYVATTLKYSPAGVPLWTNTYSMPGGSNARGLAVDANGNVFLEAYALDGAQNAYCVTVKYSNSGTPLWTNTFTWANQSEPAGLTLDANGNVLVSAYEIESSYYFITLKYSNAGLPLWTNIFAAPEFSTSESLTLPVQIATDTGGNAFLTGYSNGTNWTTLKYSGGGLPLWTNYYTVTNALGANASCLAVNTNGDVFVAGGAFYFGPGFHEVILGVTIKYSSSGAPLWTNFTSLPNGTGSAMAVDADGNVCEMEAPYNTNYGVLKLSGEGALLWTNLFTMPLGANPAALALDPGGDVFITGEGKDANTNGYYATVEYSSAGTALRTNLYTVPIAGGYTYNNYFTDATALAVDADGDVFVTGEAFPSITNEFCATIEYPNVSVTPPAFINLGRLNNQVILSWTNAGATLQFSPTTDGVYSNILGATSPFTNPATSGNEFFRLAH